VEYSSKWQHATRRYAESTAAIDLDAEGSLTIYATDEWLSIKGVRSAQRTFLTHVQAREAAVLLLEAVALYRASNDMDPDKGIAGALTALRELAPGAVTA
jgi:hypothetical protein